MLCFRPYVEFCAKQRQAATNEADKRLWKLMANIIYGMVNSDFKHVVVSAVHPNTHIQNI